MCFLVVMMVELSSGEGWVTIAMAFWRGRLCLGGSPKLTLFLLQGELRADLLVID